MKMIQILKNRIFTALIVVAVAASVSSCSKGAKKRLGITNTIPDEFQVSKTKGLDVPPHFGLQDPYRDGDGSKNTAPLSTEEQMIVDSIE